MKTEEGLVVEVIGNIAKIKAGKHNDCKNCGACPGENSVIVTAKKQIDVKPGQRVVFEVKETNALKAAFVVFVLPLIAVLIGVLLGGVAANSIGGNGSVYKILGGVIAFILVAAYIKLFDNSVSKRESSMPVIISVL